MSLVERGTIEMKRIFTGIALGALAGIIDVIPMFIQGLTWNANISAFTMWVVVGFIVSVVELKINAIAKGILTAFLVLLPTAILIGWNDPASLLPISIMTILLGGALGFSFNALTGVRNH